MHSKLVGVLAIGVVAVGVVTTAHAQHGTREMPVWGRDYMAMSANISPYYDHEAFARAKIPALTEYVYRLQAK
jgi:hypothetical protein